MKLYAHPIVIVALLLFGLTNLAGAQKAAAPPPRGVKGLASVAFSTDGKQIACGGYKTVTLIETATGRVFCRLPNHAGMVTSVQFSPDGRILAAAGGLPGRSGEIRLWDAKTGTPIRTLIGHDDAIYSIAFSPDSRRLAAASYDHFVSLWDLPPPIPATPAGDKKTKPAVTPNTQSKSQNPKPKLLKDHTDAVYGVAFSPDGKLVATAGGDRTVKVWSTATGKRLYTLSESTAELYAVAFSPDGKQLAAGGEDRALRTYNVRTNSATLARTAFVHDAPILRIAYARDGKTIVTSGQDNAVKRWDAATLAERKVYPKQPDWPQGLALSPDGRLVAVGRHNGSLALYDAISGKLVREPLKGQAVAVRKQEEVPMTSRVPEAEPGDTQARLPKQGGPTLKPASLTSINPVGVRRGGTVRFTLSGELIHDALSVYFDDPAITAKIVSPPDTNSGLLKVDAEIGSNVQIGIHRVFVQTSHGTTGSVTFAVGNWPEVEQIEPNDVLESAQKIAWPCTVVGKIDRPGDVDCYLLDARSGEELVFELIATPIRSKLQPVLALMDDTGRILTESKPRIGRVDALLGYRFTSDGRYILSVKDYENAGGPESYYRLNVGAFPVVTEAFPLGVQKGTEADIEVKGFNLGGVKTIRLQAPHDADWGRMMDLPVQPPNGPLLYPYRIAIGEDPELRAVSDNTSLEKAQSIPIPVSVNGRLSSPQQYFRFKAKKGEALRLEVMARRLNSPLDSEIEVLDGRGQPIERVVLRAVSQTDVSLSEVSSAGEGIRVSTWDTLKINDYVLIGREVLRIVALPKGPDDVVVMRGFRGQRYGYFGTTPEFHTVGAPVYKVEVYPPGSRFSPNGYPLTRLTYRNDDGGPLFGKDSALDFVAPADGEYIVRLSDVRGQYGEEYVYRLLIHPPRPDFRVVMNPAHPNIPKGGAVPITVECERYDGFNGPIEVRLEGLPPGFKATSTVIEAGETSAHLLLMAAPEATTTTISMPKEGNERMAPSPIRLVATAIMNGKKVVRTQEPENGIRLLTVLPNPDIRVSTDRRDVVIRPGEETIVKARVERQGDFGARVPIEVRNLPFGVRVLDIGLNGILITEKENSRRFTLYCEPWVSPQVRPFYVIGNVEGGVSNGALPLTLRVEPPKTEPTPRKAVHRISKK